MFNIRKGRGKNRIDDGSVYLTEVSENTNVILNTLRNKRRLRRKLQEMGLTEGVRFKVVSNTNNGPVVVNVRGSKLALGYGMSKKILVKEII